MRTLKNTHGRHKNIFMVARVEDVKEGKMSKQKNDKLITIKKREKKK